ncbi:MAG: class I SAM-dependent methyltransferase [bacterium]
MKCKICGNENTHIFNGTLLFKYSVKYYQCKTCKFLQTEDPYWLKESYLTAINNSDTGLLQRNLSLSKIITPLLYYLFNREGQYLDYAGGYGILTRLMRDTGFDFYWLDPYSENLFAKGFEYNPLVRNIELITSFESFEHFVNPLTEIKRMLSISRNIIFTTNLLPKEVPKPEEWWYYGLDHGQHISFYSKKTLEFIAKKYELNLHSKNNFHILTERQLNNFYIDLFLKQNNSGYRKILKKYLCKKCFKSLKSKTTDDMYRIIAMSKKDIL